ncbi:hypothetical protein [uncultured Tateyamaria sp.]|uniref:hypothetical protein n=1 Tax=uncultured Tateyamaria sp. TaxID=455651 RepID=UPI00262BE7D5|nr:hypothetical protein [uncultured Tateyamaria sp.]
MSGYHVVGVARSYNVLSGDQNAAGPFNNKWRAEQVRDQLQAKARLTVRPCLTCGGDFESEGPHNRMCDECRITKREVLPACTVSKARPLSVTS